MSNNMFQPTMAALGEAFSTVWYVEQMAQAAFVMNASISLGSTEGAMSTSAVWSIDEITRCTCSRIAFTVGFLTLVGLLMIPNDSHRALK